MSLPSAFWDRVDASGDCWEWSGRRDKDGYGIYQIDHTRRRAHRLMYAELVGLDPSLTIDHLCRNRGCVNPDHLEPTTMRVNVLRGYAPAAIYARRNACAFGHPYAEAASAGSKRRCRRCDAETSRRYRTRQTAVRAAA